MALGIGIGLSFNKVNNDTPPPQREDQLVCLNGEVIEISSNYYLKDISGNNRHFLITDYDFADDSGRVRKIIPYRTKATISAPVGDSALISADVTNGFLYTSGTPNQIPIISFFQNIDYENKIFCKEYSQILSWNLTENCSSGIRYITIYSSARTNNDLTNCNAYFNVTPIDETAKWVDNLNGNDTTGDGSQNFPYKTYAKAITTATTWVYIKTGSYGQGGTVKALTKNLKGLGYVEFNTYGSAYCFNCNTPGKIIERIVVNGATSGTYLINSNNITIQKCLNKNQTGYCISNLAGTNSSIYDSVLYAETYVDDLSNATSEINRCYCYGAGAIRSTVNTTTIYIKYNKIISTSTNFITSSNRVFSLIDSFNNNITCNNYIAVYDSDEINCYGDIGTCIGSYVRNTLTTSSIGEINIENSNIEVNTTSGLILGYGKSISVTRSILTQNGTGLIINQVPTTNSITINIDNNIFKTKGDGGIISIGDVTYIIENKISGEIKNNNVFGNKHYNQSYINDHGISIWSNNNIKMYNNYITGWLFPFVLKGAGTDYKDVLIYNNIILNGRLILKGIKNTKIYNNTFYNKDFQTSNINSTKFTELGDYNSINNIIKNNIIVNLYELQDSELNIELSNIGETVISNKNLFYTYNGNIVSNVTSRLTLSQWKLLGYDISSINENPLFIDVISNKFYTNREFEIGENLGPDYENGLDESSFFGSEMVLPIIVTKKRSGDSWQIGAYVK